MKSNKQKYFLKMCFLLTEFTLKSLKLEGVKLFLYCLALGDLSKIIQIILL